MQDTKVKTNIGFEVYDVPNKAKPKVEGINVKALLSNLDDKKKAFKCSKCLRKGNQFLPKGTRRGRPEIYCDECLHYPDPDYDGADYTIDSKGKNNLPIIKNFKGYVQDKFIFYEGPLKQLTKSKHVLLMTTLKQNVSEDFKMTIWWKKE